MKIRTFEDTALMFFNLPLPLDIRNHHMFQSLQSAVLVYVKHPNKDSEMQMQKCLWKMHGYLQARVDYKQWIPETEEKVRLSLNEIQSFFS